MSFVCSTIWKVATVLHLVNPSIPAPIAVTELPEQFNELIAIEGFCVVCSKTDAFEIYKARMNELLESDSKRDFNEFMRISKKMSRLTN
jgi:hypothetical protein